MTEPNRFLASGMEYGTSRVSLLGVRLTAAAARLVFPETAHSRLSVLIFHRILEEPDPLLPHEISAPQFRQEMLILSRQFSVLPLHEGLARLADGTLPPFALCITFDDGYRDNYAVALPILREYGLNATFFVASGYLDGGVMWNDALLDTMRRWPDDEIDLSGWGIARLSMRTLEDRRKAWSQLFKWMRRIGLRGRSEMLDGLLRKLPSAPPTDLMLTREQVRQLHSAGMEIGCHTRTHPILSRIREDQVYDEIVSSRRDLEELIQAPVRYFAYPNGVPEEDFGTRDVSIVENCGFEAAFTTAWGAATREGDRFQLPRFTPWDKGLSKYLLRLILSRRIAANQVST